MNRRPFVTVAATVGVLVTAAFALPNLPPNPLTDMVDNRVFEEKGKHFATASDAPTRGEPAFALPSWIPKDATDVRIKARTGGEARLIRFTLGATPLDDPKCPAGASKLLDGPPLHAKWWPGDTRPEERTECRDSRQYQVSVRGKRVYAWTDGTPSPGSSTKDSTPVAQMRR
ncbi:hypothetical protein [Streptomyces sp. NPDC051567]|uniref:hypothetical protein n=1 Tax=Streptomyces sp. NPDC051567 TaxID=3365660 RepID=UPI00378748D5